MAVQNLNIAQYNKVASDYPYSLTSKIGDFSTWVSDATYNDGSVHEDTPQTRNEEHWSGTTRNYYEQGVNGWSASNGFTGTYTKTATLPAGNYVIKVAARASSSVTGTLSATATVNTVALPNAGAYTRGINTDGEASWSDGDTFARGGDNNDGYGWEWRFLPFTVATDDTEVTITIQESTTATHNWFSVADAELLSDEDKSTPVTLDEISDMASTISSNDGELATVTLKRNIVASYNTVCLPFDLTAAQVQTVFGAGSVVYAYSESSANANEAMINFNSVGEGTITANVPVLVKATAESTQKVIEGVTIVNPSSTTVAGTNFDFVGVYDAMAVPTGDYFIGVNGGISYLYKSLGSTNIKPFRAYIHAKSAGVKPVLFIDDEATSIDAINGIEAENGAIYNLAGQRLNKMQKGINIINGRKVLY